MLEKAREKIEALVDDNSFVEIGADATAIATDYNPVAPQEASDGVITGHGLVDGSLTFFYAQDEDVLGGSLGSAHIHKLKHLYDMAIRLGAPIVGFINSSGVRIQESFDVMENMAELCQVSQKASGRVPQILGIFGRCAGVLSVFASMHDFVYMTDDSQMFLQSPNALDSDVDTSTADYQYRVAGNVDEIGSELEMICVLCCQRFLDPTVREDSSRAVSMTLTGECWSLRPRDRQSVIFARRFLTSTCLFRLKKAFIPR